MPPTAPQKIPTPMPTPIGWPLDEDGSPLAMISMSAHELVGLPNYSNVTIGPAVVFRLCKDNPADRQAALKELAQEVEGIVAEERELVSAALRGK